MMFSGLTLNHTIPMFNPFPHDTILDQTKYKGFADNQLNYTKIKISVFDRVEDIVHNVAFSRVWERSILKTFWEKEKLLVTQCFLQQYILSVSKCSIVW